MTDNQNQYTPPQEKDIHRLYLLKLQGRWLLVIISWLTLMPWGLWRMQETISLCIEYCTWATIRAGMEFNPWATLAITFCLGFLTSVLVWQSLYILRGGLSDKEKYYFHQEVLKIRSQGAKHWLRRWFPPQTE